MSRYANIIQVFGQETFSKISNSKVLCVGAGGIGCELLKNLVLSGFQTIEIIDLDTIDVSNLNRQFLFRHHHVGKSKSEIARESALEYNPKCNIIAYHGNIKDSKFGMDYFSQFDVVFNALDNIDARKHVNRMCLSANVPLIDGGTAGYLGQVVTIKKGVTECYECVPKATQKSFAVCTIRSNPSTIVHCVVWAKLLFERLFGKEDDNNAITSFEGMKQHEGDFERVIFGKVFHDDVEELVKMKDVSVWSGKIPKGLVIPDKIEEVSKVDDRLVWSFEQNVAQFFAACVVLKERREKAGDVLNFDKDDEDALDLVTSAANLRAFNFNIEDRKSRFEIKALAGNIVPAIATTNAIIAGIMVQETIKVLNGEIEKTKHIHNLRNPSMVKRKPCLLYPMANSAPNKDCFVCQAKFMTLKLSLSKTTLGYFVNDILKKYLTLLHPMIVNGQNLLYECGDDIEEFDAKTYEDRLVKTLSELRIENGVSLMIEDLFQDINWTVSILDKDDEIDQFELNGRLLIEKADKLVEKIKGEDVVTVQKRNRDDDELEEVKEKKIE